MVTYEKLNNDGDLGIKITSTAERWDSATLMEVEVVDNFIVYQSDIQHERDQIAAERAVLDKREAEIDAREAKLTKIYTSIK